MKHLILILLLPIYSFAQTIVQDDIKFKFDYEKEVEFGESARKFVNGNTNLVFTLDNVYEKYGSPTTSVTLMDLVRKKTEGRGETSYGLLCGRLFNFYRLEGIIDNKMHYFITIRVYDPERQVIFRFVSDELEKVQKGAAMLFESFEIGGEPNSFIFY